MYKFVNGIDEVDMNQIKVTPKNNPRGISSVDSKKRDVYKTEIVRNCDQRHSFFTNRIANEWNSLPDEVVNAKSVNEFKCRIDRFRPITAS